MSGPISVVSSRPSPTTMRPQASASRGRKFRPCFAPESPRPRAAHFPLSGEDAKHRVFQRGVGISVGKDNVRTFAAQFEGDLFQVSRRCSHDLAPSRRSARESDFIDSMAFRKGRAHRSPRPEHQLRHSGRKPASSINSKSRTADAGVSPRVFRYSNFPPRGRASFHPPEQRIIPRNDLPAHPDRFAHRLGDDIGIAHLVGLPLRFRRSPA